MSKYHPRPVIIVTGANSGIGFGICHRLLVQLCRSQPPDAYPQHALVDKPRYLIPSGSSSSSSKEKAVKNASIPTYDGLTLILACRSIKRANAARQELLRLLEREVHALKEAEGYDGHAEVFAKNVQLVVHQVDLAEVKSVFNFMGDIKSTYPHVSHLICNAGVASFYGYDWPVCAMQIIREPIVAVTRPLFKLQRKGERSSDGLGWVWQCNVFGHYVMARLLEPLLQQYWTKFSLEPRVIWMSSLEAMPSCFDLADWHLLNNDHSYEGSKYQTDLLVGYFESQQQKRLLESTTEEEQKKAPRIRHLLVHPGVASTNIIGTSLGKILIYFMDMAFYIARWLGSPNHPIAPFKGAISAVHLALVTLPLLTALPREEKPPSPLKFGSQATRLGEAYVDVSVVEEWDERWEDGALVAQKCEELYEGYLEKYGGKEH